jgi:hypothetical protein
MKRFTLLGVAVLMTVVLAACSTPRPETPVPLGAQEKAQLLKRAKAPQVFGLTAYTSDDGAVFAGVFRQHEGHVARVAFASDPATTTPAVKVGDDALVMLIDSSAAESWLTVEAVPSLRAVALAGPNPFERVPRHVFDTLGGFGAVVPKLTIDTLHVENALMYVRNARGPLGPLTRWEKTPYFDGVLGADFLRSFQFVRISLRGRYLVFSATDAYPPPATPLATLPTIDLNDAIAIEAVINGEKTPVILDIAGDFEVAMSTTDLTAVRQISLGDLVIRQAQVDSAYELGFGRDTPVRIGRQLLERYDLVINNQGREVIFERPVQ